MQACKQIGVEGLVQGQNRKIISTIFLIACHCRLYNCGVFVLLKEGRNALSVLMHLCSHGSTIGGVQAFGTGTHWFDSWLSTILPDE